MRVVICGSIIVVFSKCISNNSIICSKNIITYNNSKNLNTAFYNCIKTT